MSSELETAGAASLGGLSAGGKADLSGQPCRNCGEPVEKRHCPRCGQLASSFHRPFYSLVAESISDSLALDGRIARTIPLLLFRPGVLSRRYSDGKRARYVPPFRLFLLTSLVFYFLVFAVVGSSGVLDNVSSWNENGRQFNQAEREALIEYFAGDEQVAGNPELEALLEEFRRGEAAEDTETGAGADAETGEQADTLPVAPAGEPAPEEAPDETSAPDNTVLTVNGDGIGERIISNPRLFLSALETWAPRFSLLLVPLTVLALSLMYFWRRRYYIYDHAIHALHLHSWIYLAATLAIVLSPILGGWSAGFFFIALPVYTMFSLRGAYRSGIITSFLRMCVLSVFWIVSLSVLMVGVIAMSAMSV